MKFALVGGDERSAILGELLCADGHKLRCFALEQAAMDPAVVKVGCLQSCVYGADCVLLPVPAERGGLLHAPLSAEKLPIETVLGALWPGQLVCGGKLGEELCLRAVQGKLPVADLMTRPAFTVGNAALTAEGALQRLMENSPRSLWQSAVLITGWGRIASILAQRLLGLGARVTVAARKAGQRAMAEAMGCRALSFAELENALGGFDFAVNTVPAPVLSDSMLCCLRGDCLLLELASLPGGFDRQLAENIGLRVLQAPGLPGSCTPYSAAKLMQRSIYEIIREQEE